jgi:hypothetical protein
MWLLHVNVRYWLVLVTPPLPGTDDLGGPIVIVLSRMRSRLIVLALVTAVAGCEISHMCTAIGSTEGLAITLDGTFDAGKVFQINLAEITPTPEVVPFMTCSFAPSAPWTAGQQLLCQSVVSHSELVNIIQIGDYEPKKLPIKISSAGALVSEQTFEPVFTTREINGPAAERAGSRRSR